MSLRTPSVTELLLLITEITVINPVVVCVHNDSGVSFSNS